MNYLLEGVKIARISTVPFFVSSQLSSQLKDISVAGADVFIITSPANPYEKVIEFDSCLSLIEVTIPRKVEYLNDLKSLLDLYMTFRRNKFDIVHSTTPKAGLLVAIAGFVARVPLRIHTFTGQAWVEKAGFSKFVLKLFDKVIISLNSQCYADSSSQIEFLISAQVCKQGRVAVLGEGSLAGVNVARFDPEIFTPNQKLELKQDLAITVKDLVFIFVGRITKDKGIIELIKAFKRLHDLQEDVKLLLVGPIDGDLHIDGLPLKDYVSLNDTVKLVGFTDCPEKYLSISDVFCLPSYREGFGTVIIESAAMGLPAVASNIYGLSDAVEDGKTGILVESKNIDELFNALENLVKDKSNRLAMGENAKFRATRSFNSSYISSLVVSEYIRLLEGS